MTRRAMALPRQHPDALVRVHHHALELPQVGDRPGRMIPWRQIAGLRWEGGLAPAFGFGGVKVELDDEGTRAWELVVVGFGKHHARDSYRLSQVIAARARLVRTEVKYEAVTWRRADLPQTGGPPPGPGRAAAGVPPHG